MAARSIFHKHRILVTALGSTAFAVSVLPPRRSYADSPETESLPNRQTRKPIYDDLVPPTSSKPLPPRSADTTDANPADATSSLATEAKNRLTAAKSTSSSTPTDRLAAQIRHARLWLYDFSAASETRLNDALTNFFALETRFTERVAALAPPPSAREPLVPGAIYVLVATLGGTILSRNRGILLRTLTPTTFGIVAAYTVLPATMRNVEGLVAEWEEGYPEVKRLHEQTRDRVQQIWETSKAHAAMTVEMGEQKLSDARKTVEEWVSQGK